MRSILAILYVFLYAIISLPMYLVVKAKGRRDPKEKALFSQRFINWGFRCVCRICGCRPTVTGLENVPDDEAVLYIFNHKGIFDIICGYTFLKPLTAIVAKKETGKLPCISLWMKYINCIFMDRSDIRASLQAILDATALVKNGTSILIFPEGTRSKTDELLPFKDGSFKIAQKAKCPIIPVAVRGTNAVFDDHVPWAKKANVTFTFGKPFYLSDLPDEYKKHPGEYTQMIIKEMLSSVFENVLE